MSTLGDWSTSEESDAPGRWSRVRRLGEGRSRRRNAGARRRRPGSLTDRGRALLAAGVTLTASGVILGFVDLTRVGLLALALPILALGTYRLTRPRLEVQRHLSPQTLTVGERVDVSLALRNRSPYPCLTMLAQERLSPDLGGAAHFVIPGIGSRANRQLHYSLGATRRGRHVIGPLSVRAGDPFGLTRGLVDVGGTVEVVALPAVHPLGAQTDGLGADGSSDTTATIVGRSGLDDVALRAYQVGDDLRRIHWPVTAHRGELMVRQEGRSPIRSATLVLDPELPVGPTSRRWATPRPRDGAGRGSRGSRGSRGVDDRRDGLASAPDPRSPARSDRSTSATLDWGVEALASIATHLVGLGYSLRLVVPSTVEDNRASSTLDLFETVRALALVDPTVPVVREPSGRRRTRAAALAPAVQPAAPVGEDGATESSLVTAAREATRGSGLVVLVVGTHEPQRARDLLTVLSPGAVGLALLLDPGVSSGRSRAMGTGRGGSDAESVHDLVSFAASGGWRTHVVDAPQDIAQAWAHLLSSAAAA